MTAEDATRPSRSPSADRAAAGGPGDGGPAAGAVFAERWNALDASERRRLRRLVRIGRPGADVADAELAVGFARYQRDRKLWRWFWAWFSVAMVLALLTAATIHPLVIGVALAIGGQTVLAWWNYRRAERVNAALLDR